MQEASVGKFTGLYQMERHFPEPTPTAEQKEHQNDSVDRVMSHVSDLIGLLSLMYFFNRKEPRRICFPCQRILILSLFQVGLHMAPVLFFPVIQGRDDPEP